MAFNGTGTFVRIYNWVTDAANGILVCADRMDTEMDGMATGLSNCVTRDGQSVPTANLPMGGFKLTGLGNGAAPTDAVNYGQVFTSPTFSSPTFTGTVNGAGATTFTVPTATAGDSSTNAASTAFVQGVAMAAALPNQAGNDGKSIVTAGGVASWGVSGVAGGGTGQSSYTIGDILYASGATALSKLAASTSGYVLTSGGAGVAPSWASPYPDQTGNSGKFLKTNGTAASWDYAGISTVGSTVTDNYTITGTTPTIYPTVTTAIGKSLTAPDATTLSKGLNYVIDNKAGGYPVGFRDSTGTLVGAAVAAGGIAQVYLEDNSTAAGTWRVVGTNLEPGLITIDNTLSSTYASTVLAPFVALDANTSIHFAKLSSGFAAFVVDNTGKVITTPVTVATGAAFVPRTVFKVSSTSAIVFYDAAGGTAYAVVLTLSGSSPSYSLAVGTAATSTDPNAFSQEDFSGAPKVAQLSSTLYLYSYTQTTNTSVVAISVSGTTVTIGTAANIIAANSVAQSTTTYALTATTALVLYLSGAGPYVANAVVVSVSGVVCTAGTPATVFSSIASGNPPSSTLLSATKCLVAADNGGTSVQAAAVTITGTAVAVGGALSVESIGMSGSNYPYYTGSGATRYNPHLWAIGANTAGFWYLDSSGISRAVVLSESGGTITAGAKLYGSISSAASSAAGAGAVMPQGTAEFISLKQDTSGTASTYKFNAIPHKISGTSTTTGANAYLDTLTGSSSTAVGLTTIRLSSGDYVVSFNGAAFMGAIPVFRSNGDAISVRGGIRTPNLILSNNIGSFTAPFSNRLVLLGNTTYQGTTIGPSTYQLRLLNVEICA